jgi:hypothetical protein
MVIVCVHPARDSAALDGLFFLSGVGGALGPVRRVCRTSSHQLAALFVLRCPTSGRMVLDRGCVALSCAGNTSGINGHFRFSPLLFCSPTFGSYHGAPADSLRAVGPGDSPEVNKNVSNVD